MTSRYATPELPTTQRTAPTPVDFDFDPVCPWTWNTYRWLVEVAEAKILEIRLRPLSLKVLNANRETPEEYRAAVEAGHAALRIVAALQADNRYGDIARLYDELGRRFFYEQGQQASIDQVVTAAEAIGLGALASVAHDPAYDEAVERSTQEALDLAGPDVGSPILIPGEGAGAYHGPIVSPVPTGEDALRLWDAVMTLARLPGVYEVKRGRNTGPDLGLAA